MTWVAYKGVEATTERTRMEVEQALAAIVDLLGRDLLATLVVYVTRRDR